MSASPSWAGTLFLGGSWMVYAGPLGRTEPHAHHAVQVVSAPQGVSVVDEHGERFAAGSLVVPANLLHSLHADGEEAIVTYLDPLAVRLTSATIQTSAGLPVRPSSPEDAAAAARWAERVLLVCGGRPASAVSPIVEAVLDAARERLPETVRLREIADALGFAPSTITHRFTAEVGIPFRRWVLWERLQLAAGAVGRGGNLTNAAHAAGFADSAHLNRTFRRMFGIAPSDVAGVVRWVAVERPQRSSG